MTTETIRRPECAPRSDCLPDCSCQASADEWYRRYARVIWQYSMKRLGDPAAADDCTNETFLRAFAQRQRFACRGHGVRRWLFTIARNTVHDFHRPAWRRLELVVDSLPDSPDSAPSPEDLVMQRVTDGELLHRAGELARLIDELSEDQAQCVRLRFFAQLSVAQAAESMDRDARAIRALQYRAVRALAKKLAATPRADTAA